MDKVFAAVITVGMFVWIGCWLFEQGVKSGKRQAEQNLHRYVEQRRRSEGTR